MKAIITCALTGVLTDPASHPVPVTPKEMASEARRAYEAGASIMHIHLREQAADKGHLPSWDVALSRDIQQAIREACPDVIINHTSGVVGNDYGGALSCISETKPEIAACNAGTLNYLKTKADGSWAWKPILFDNMPDKISDFLAAMGTHTLPEFECFDTGIVRSVAMYKKNGMYKGRLMYNFVTGVESGMPALPELLPILIKLIEPESLWQVTAIGRSDIWAMHAETARLGGNLRTGLEDTFYLPNGEKATSNGQLIESLALSARNAGREIATPLEAREILGLTSLRA